MAIQYNAMGWVCALGALLGGVACGGGHTLGAETSGGSGGAAGDEGTGAVTTGGANTGGANTGGARTGGETSGGVDGVGGSETGGGAPLSMEATFPETQETSRKLDLLFVVDNSISMADKQELLATAVPGLLQRLINPRCLDASGTSTQPASPTDPCPAGSSRELVPMSDAHIGIISSSLGGHGGEICTPAMGQDIYNPEMDDRGELLGIVRPGTSTGTLTASGFYAWDGTGSVDTLLADVTSGFQAVGESGCGFEATNEAWYRFLVDPSPPVDVPVVDPALTTTQRGAVNNALLAQRAAFLRPDSAVMVVVLSDENDCSVRDDGVSWLMGIMSQRIPRSRAICATDPNDPCCRSCADLDFELEEECGPARLDPSCALGEYSQPEEPLNLRCFEQKRRFGIDFLYPIDRYVRGLTAPTVVNDRDGTEVQNPLYAGGRDPSLISYVGIVGVPWQSIARNPGTTGGLRFKPALQLHQEGAWPALVGEPESTTPPTDPFMVESVNPRTGTSALSGLAIEPASAPGGASPANGHEYDSAGRDDLQYACVFPLLTPRQCNPEYVGGCDCMATPMSSPNRPLCQAPGSTSTGTTQYYAKAYPGLRHLAIMQRIGRLAVPASICPRALDASGPEYGYGPVAESMVVRLREIFK